MVQDPGGEAQGLAAVVPAQAAVALPVGAVPVAGAGAAVVVGGVNPLQVRAPLRCR